MNPRFLSFTIALCMLIVLMACGIGQKASDGARVAQQQAVDSGPTPIAAPVDEAEPAEEAEEEELPADEMDMDAGDDTGVDTTNMVEADTEPTQAMEMEAMEMEEAPEELVEQETDHSSEDVPVPVEVNPFVLTADDALSTFGLDVDTASYTSARNYINDDSMPPQEAVRVEEFINYFTYDYPEPQEGAMGIYVDGALSPWNTEESPSTHIVRVGIQGKHIDDSQRKPAILTFVIDVSGSMDDPIRLPLVKEALRLLVEQLHEGDKVGIVVYSNDTRVVLEHTGAEQHDRIIEHIDSLQTEGATNVEDGLRLGYEQANKHYQVGATNRIILCSDGVANVGETGPDAIRKVIQDYTKQGILLTTVGFGMGDYNDVLMEQLADDGNGNYAYVDTLDEAKRIFVENLTGMLQVIAKDAKVQVAFNPDVVQSYRLLGYENRDIADEDFRNDTVDAGEVGAGHNVTALYELMLNEQGEGNALTVQLRYEDYDSGEVQEIQQPFARGALAERFDETSPHFKLAVAVAGFAEQLRGSGYAQNRSFEDVLAIAEDAGATLSNEQDVQEFLALVKHASEL